MVNLSFNSRDGVSPTQSAGAGAGAGAPVGTGVIGVNNSSGANIETNATNHHPAARRPRIYCSSLRMAFGMKISRWEIAQGHFAPEKVERFSELQFKQFTARMKSTHQSANTGSAKQRQIEEIANNLIATDWLENKPDNLIVILTEDIVGGVYFNPQLDELEVYDQQVNEPEIYDPQGEAQEMPASQADEPEIYDLEGEAQEMPVPQAEDQEIPAPQAEEPVIYDLEGEDQEIPAQDVEDQEMPAQDVEEQEIPALDVEDQEMPAPEVPVDVNPPRINLPRRNISEVNPFEVPDEQVGASGGISVGINTTLLSPGGRSIFDFFTGVGTNGEDLKAADIYKLSKNELEDMHHYIQWIFPTSEKSAHNDNAPLVDMQLRRIFANNSELRATHLGFLELMMSFYGLEMKVAGIGKVKNFDTHQPWLGKNDHNHYRLTRIMKSLWLCGNQLRALQLQAALKMIGEEYHINPQTRDAWAKAFTKLSQLA